MARRAKSLTVLIGELDTIAPKRRRDRDGWLGNEDHQARASRHNPNNDGVVCAQDVTHDPAGGVDIHAIARRVVLRPHPNLEYVISNRQVAKRRTGFVWEPYRVPAGGDDHTRHAHFAVGRGPDDEPTPRYDDIDTWGIAPLTEEDDMPQLCFVTADDVSNPNDDATWWLTDLVTSRRAMEPGEPDVYVRGGMVKAGIHGHAQPLVISRSALERIPIAT